MRLTDLKSNAGRGHRPQRTGRSATAGVTGAKYVVGYANTCDTRCPERRSLTLAWTGGQRRAADSDEATNRRLVPCRSHLLFVEIIILPPNWAGIKITNGEGKAIGYNHEDDASASS